MDLSILCIGWVGTCYTQVAPLHHWVGFADKTGGGIDLNSPEAGALLLSPRALERRNRQGIPLDSLDLPVPADRIADVLSVGDTEQGPSVALLHRSKWLNGMVIQLDTNLLDSAGMAGVLQDIAQLDGVAEVKRTRWYRDMAPPIAQPQPRSVGQDVYQSGPTAYGAAWTQARQLKVDLVHGLGHRGAGMMVGVLDSGFDRVDTNPAFDRARNAGLIQIGGNFPNGGAISPFIYEEHYHGAMVLSTMAGHLDTPGGQHYMGTAPDATYVLFRTEDVGWEHLVEEYHWVAAAERADSMGCDVLNTSLGYSLFDETSDSHSLATWTATPSPLLRPPTSPRPKACLVFNSAGNSGNSPWQKVTAPADGDSVIAVGAVDLSGTARGFQQLWPDRRWPHQTRPLCRWATPCISTRRLDRDGQRHVVFLPHPLWCRHQLVECTPRTPQRGTSASLLESAHQWNAPDTRVGYGIPDLWKPTSCSAGGRQRESGECSYTPIPLVPRTRIFMWSSRKSNLRSASGTAP